jgi:hypothetical protein
MNKKAGFNILWIFASIIIILLIFVALIFVFKVDFFKHKDNNGLVYTDFLFKVVDSYNNESIKSSVLILNNKNNLLYKFNSSENYETFNLSVNNNVILTRKECKNVSSWGKNKTVCKDIKLDEPLNYSEYCFVISSEGYYTKYLCQRLFYNNVDFEKNHMIVDLNLTPIAEVKMFAVESLKSGSGEESFNDIIYIHAKDGEIREPTVCINRTLGIVNFWIENSNMILLNNVDRPIINSKCYKLSNNLIKDASFNFTLIYKPLTLASNDNIEVILYDKDYVFQENKTEYFFNKEDLGLDAISLKITK